MKTDRRRGQVRWVDTYPDTARTTRSGAAREFSDDGGGAEVASHGEVGDTGRRTAAVNQ